MRETEPFDGKGGQYHSEDEFPELKDVPLGILLRRVEHYHDMRVRERLDSCGITKALGPFLMTISKNEGATQIEIAGKMHFTAATVSVTIQKLLDCGYITRIQDSTDSRQLRIFLTEEGKKKAGEMHKIFGEIENELVLPLTESEITELRRLLLKIIEKK